MWRVKKRFKCRRQATAGCHIILGYDATKEMSNFFIFLTKTNFLYLTQVTNLILSFQIRTDLLGAKIFSTLYQIILTWVFLSSPFSMWWAVLFRLYMDTSQHKCQPKIWYKNPRKTDCVKFFENCSGVQLNRSRQDAVDKLTKALMVLLPKFFKVPRLAKIFKICLQFNFVPIIYWSIKVIFIPKTSRTCHVTA